jgi:Protein of unknown function (DUF1573)
MKAFASLALVVPVVCVAQTQAPAPVITFETTHHDFGKINTDRKVSYRFKVTNTGNAILNITRLNPSCGCTSTVLGKWSLAPAESTEVEATFDPHGFRGPVHKSIQVISDDPAHGTITLTFEGEVIQDIMPSTNTVFLYDLQRSVPKKATVRLVSGNGQPVQVKETKAPGAPYLSATTKQEGNDAILDIEVDGRKISASKVRGVDALTVITSSDKMPVLTINVQWEMKPSVVPTPAQVAWVEAAGRELRAPVVLKQAEGKAFRVKDYRSSNPLITLDGMAKTGTAEQNLQVVLSAAAKPGTYNENLILFLDDPNQPELNLRVSAVLR